MDERLDEIRASVTIIEAGVQELLLWKASQEQMCAAHLAQTRELRTEIYGNPDSNYSGMKTKVNRLLNCKNALKSSREVWRDFFLWIARYLIVAAVLAFTGWLLLTYRASTIVSMGGV